MSNDVNFTVPVSTPQLSVVNGGDITAHNVIATNNVQAGVDVDATNNVNATKNVTAGVNVSATLNVAAGQDVTAVRDVHATRDVIVGRNVNVTGGINTTSVSAQMIYVLNPMESFWFYQWNTIGPSGVPDGSIAFIQNANIDGTGLVTGAPGSTKTLAVCLAGQWWQL
jgi:hypothetical protein